MLVVVVGLLVVLELVVADVVALVVDEVVVGFETEEEVEVLVVKLLVVTGLGGVGVGILVVLVDVVVDCCTGPRSIVLGWLWKSSLGSSARGLRRRFATCTKPSRLTWRPSLTLSNSCFSEDISPRCSALVYVFSGISRLLIGLSVRLTVSDGDVKPNRRKRK